MASLRLSLIAQRHRAAAAPSFSLRSSSSPSVPHNTCRFYRQPSMVQRPWTTVFKTQTENEIQHQHVRQLQHQSRQVHAQYNSNDLQQQQTETRPPKTAVLMLNLGGPSTLEDVQPFLHRLFSDPDLIPIPFQKHLAPLIAKRRTPKIQAQYAQIGGGSPIRYWTEKQGKLLEQKLDQMCPESAPHKTFATFRYAPPLTEDTLAEIKKLGIKRAVAFTQYPQYSCSTTGSSMNEIYRQVKAMGMEKDIQWSVIDRWPVHKGLIKAFAERVSTGLAKFDEKDRSKVIILFSAHSLPLVVVDRGDPYVQEVAATVQQVMEELGHSHPFRLVWQSKVGPQPWMGPQTSDVLEALGKKGEKNILLVPIAFTSDHIETLFELDLEGGEQAEEVGITNLRRVESLNDSPLFISSMADIVADHLKKYSKEIRISRTWDMTCPKCKKDICKETRRFFKEQN